MNRKLQRILIIGEAKLRVLLLSFCVYATIYAVVSQVFPDYADSIVHNYFYIIAISVFSFCGGLVLNEEIEGLKKEYEWSWTAKNKEEYICTEFVGLVSIGVFYFLVQMGICMIFFPEFDQIKIGSEDHYLYPYLFTFNSTIIYLIYRLTIIKIELIETKQES